MGGIMDTTDPTKNLVEPKPVLPSITIQVNENGSLTVSGTINDKILAYGLLESAKDIIREHVATQAVNSMIQAKKNGHRFTNFLRK